MEVVLEVIGALSQIHFMDIHILADPTEKHDLEVYYVVRSVSDGFIECCQHKHSRSECSRTVSHSLYSIYD
jgi:hypothetical protein